MTSNQRHDKDEEKPRSYLKWLLSLFGLLLIPFVIIWWPGCKQYPEVSSPESMALMKRLYFACNTRNEEKLTQVEKDVEKMARKDRMTPREQEAFHKIIGMARGGDWPAAEKASLKFAQDQVR